MNDELTRAVYDAAQRRGNRYELPCAEAFRLAAKWCVEVRDIGRICDQKKIKIIQCQLGCFQ